MIFLSLGFGYHQIQIVELEFLQRRGTQIRVNILTLKEEYLNLSFKFTIPNIYRNTDHDSVQQELIGNPGSPVPPPLPNHPLLPSPLPLLPAQAVPGGSGCFEEFHQDVPGCFGELHK